MATHVWVGTQPLLDARQVRRRSTSTRSWCGHRTATGGGFGGKHGGGVASEAAILAERSADRQGHVVAHEEFTSARCVRGDR